MAAADSGKQNGEAVHVRKSGWADLFLQEDWWAIWLGVGTMVIAIVLFSNGSTALKTLAINPGGLKWSSFDQLADHFGQNAHLYLYQFIAWLEIFSQIGRA